MQNLYQSAFYDKVVGKFIVDKESDDKGNVLFTLITNLSAKLEKYKINKFKNGEIG